MKALIIYYSQTGQLKGILESVTAPLKDTFELTWEELKPAPDFPFPWKGMPFFQVFPESVQEIPCKLEPLQINPDDDYDLIILGIQVWYLSPSIPVSSFLQSETAHKVMNGKPVITVQGIRNMWTMSMERIKQRISGNGGTLIGNIVLEDPHHNLVSVITIVRWMMKGKQERTKLLPAAGIPAGTINTAGKFGEIILESFNNNATNKLQVKLVNAGAVKIHPILVFVEKRGFAMFRIWSKFILKKGSYNDPRREKRLTLFQYYLFGVIYLVSPIPSVILWIIFKLNPHATKRIIRNYSSI